MKNKIQISISLPQSLVDQVDREAAKVNRNRSNYIATKLQKLVDQQSPRRL